MINEFIIANPKLGIVLVSVCITFFMTLIQKRFTDQTRMKELKKIQKKHQQKIKKYRDDPKKMNELSQEMMSYTIEMMKLSMKPMLFTMIPLLLLFGWIRGLVTITSLANTWLWWYIGSSILASITFRKIFDVA